MSFKKLFKYMNEISRDPVKVDWYYKKIGVWYGFFEVNDISYDVTFEREDYKHPNNDLNTKIVSLKFSRPDLPDPFAFSGDFNKPLVIANTIANALMDYKEQEGFDIFVIKALSSEPTRVKKYREITQWMKTHLHFFAVEQEQYKEYDYFIVYKTSKDFRNPEIKEYINKTIN